MPSSRQNPFYLLVALNDSLTATGLLFLDDGESIGDNGIVQCMYVIVCVFVDSIKNEQYSLISYTCNEVCFVWIM